MEREEMQVEAIGAMGDNFIHLAAVVVDPGIAAPGNARLRKRSEREKSSPRS